MCDLSFRRTGVAVTLLWSTAALSQGATDQSEADIIVPPVVRTAFASGIAIDGDTVVVGARSDDEVADNAGAAYVFVQEASGWVLQQKLTAADGQAGDAFGFSVDVWGDYVVVGAPSARGASGSTGSGVAYVFRRAGTTWTQDARFTGTLTLSTDPFDTPGTDNFGRAVAINGDIPAESTDNGLVLNVIVGAPRDNHSQSSDAGSAFLFQLSADGTAWEETAKLVANDPSDQADFGVAVDLDGDHMIVGATRSGAYIFVRRGSQNVWGLETKVGDGVGGDMGSSVAAFARNGRATFAVGAPTDGELGFSAGAVYLYQGSTQPFAEQKLFPADIDEFDRYGSDVAVLSGRVLATAITAENGVDSAGAGYLFQDRGDTWVHTRRYLGTGASRMQFVAGAGDTALVGDQSYPTSLLDGIVYVFDGLDVMFGTGFEP